MEESNELEVEPETCEGDKQPAGLPAKGFRIAIEPSPEWEEAMRLPQTVLRALQRHGREIENLKQAVHKRNMDPLLRDLLQFQEGLETLGKRLGEHGKRLSKAKLYHQFQSTLNGLLTEHRTILRRHGVEAVEEADGIFDPGLHRAAEVVEDGREDGTVLRVLRRGYRFEGRVLQPAEVAVSRKTTSNEGGE